MKSKIISAIALFLSLLTPEVGYVSKIHFQTVTLEFLTMRASHIVLVTRDDPAYSEEEIAIHADKSKYPPFKFIKSYFVIKEVLYSQKMKAGEKITVLPANLDTEKMNHTRYYLDGMSRSPMYERYESKVIKSTDKQMILFLHSQDNNEYEYITFGASEGISKKEEIQSLIDMRLKSDGNVIYAD